MYKISNDLLPLFVKDMMTEVCILHITRSSAKVEKDDNRKYNCLKKSNYKFSVIKTVSYGPLLDMTESRLRGTYLSHDPEKLLLPHFFSNVDAVLFKMTMTRCSFRKSIVKVL